jgi:hypothetical protein
MSCSHTKTFRSSIELQLWIRFGLTGSVKFYDTILPERLEVCYTVATLQGYIPAITFQKRRRAGDRELHGEETEVLLSAADREGWRFVFEERKVTPRSGEQAKEESSGASRR